MDIYNNIFNKSTNILIVMDKPMTIYDIHIASDIQYSWTLLVLKQMEKEGIVSSKKDGRKRFVILTEKGKELRKHFMHIKDVLGGKHERDRSSKKGIRA